MQNPFFEKPILNSPYAYPQRHWELDEQGQPTQRIIDNRRKAEFISPIPRPRKQKGSGRQASLVLDQGQGLSTEEQQYNITALINGVRAEVDQWRGIPNPADWRVTPETARLLQHWRHHAFSSIRWGTDAGGNCSVIPNSSSRGGREVTREVEHYNLDMILALGFRVRSPVGVRFRQ